MTTRSTYRSNLRRALLDDNSQVFTDAELNVWLDEAIYDYGTNFPRETYGSINCVTGTHEYALTSFTGLIAVILVEHPAGQDPPRYLQRRPVDDLRDSGFWGEQFYDLYGEPPHTIVIAEECTTGNTIKIRYLADHTLPANDAATLTVPDRDLTLLTLFIRWRALVALETGQATDPKTGTGETPLLSMLGTNARGARREYDRAVKDRTRSQSHVVRWGSSDDWRT